MYFVLGDNRNDSEDSRYWGFVPLDALEGRPFLVYFSSPTAEDMNGKSLPERLLHTLSGGIRSWRVLN